MVGGQVIENIITDTPESFERVRRLWTIDRDGDEVAVYADIKQAENISVGDLIWWQSGTIYWTKADYSTEDQPIKKIGFSFDPNKKH